MFAETFHMGMLDRYKKKGGFIQLVQLIETTAKPKQDQFLQIIKNEDPVWEEAVRQKVLTPERILTWPPSTMAEIVSRVQPLTIVGFLFERDPKVVEACLSTLSHSEKRKIFDLMSEKKITPAEKATCCHRLVTEVRGLIQHNYIKIDKVDPEMAIPEDYEEKLGHKNDSIDLTKVEAVDSDIPQATHLNFDKWEKQDQGNSNKDEVEFLKKKVNALIAENAQLKHDLNLLRGKLDQIRKIA